MQSSLAASYFLSHVSIFSHSLYDTYWKEYKANYKCLWSAVCSVISFATIVLYLHNTYVFVVVNKHWHQWGVQNSGGGIWTVVCWSTPFYMYSLQSTVLLHGANYSVSFFSEPLTVPNCCKEDEEVLKWFNSKEASLLWVNKSKSIRLKTQTNVWAKSIVRVT